MSELKKSFDLEERTAKFGEDTIKFCKELSIDTISQPIISQLIRSATSIGANYMEANGASSKKDFRNKIFLCKKEAQESRHWIRMLVSCFPKRKDALAKLWQEAKELSMIFHKISANCTGN